MTEFYRAGEHGHQVWCKMCFSSRNRNRFKGERPSEKPCRICGKTKPGQEFGISCENSDGLDSRCRACRKEAGKVYRALHPDPCRERCLNWQRSNPEKRAAIARRFRRRHLAEDVRKVTERKRMLLAAEGTHTPEEWNKMKHQFGNRCVCCGVIEKDAALGRITKDHILPIRAGGSNWISNIQPLCVPCNTRKGSRCIDYRPTRAQKTRLRST